MKFLTIAALAVLGFTAHRASADSNYWVRCRVSNGVATVTLSTRGDVNTYGEGTITYFDRDWNVINSQPFPWSAAITGGGTAQLGQPSAPTNAVRCEVEL